MTEDLADLIIHLARQAQNTSQTGLTAAQWTALRYFARANGFSRTPSAFSEFHATTRGTASQTVKSLVAMGLLRHVAHGSDARRKVIEVTPAGQDMLQHDPLGDLRAVLKSLPDAQYSALSKAVPQLLAALAERRDAPVFGTCGDCQHCEITPSTSYCHCTQSWLAASDMAALCIDFRPARIG